MFNVLLAAHSAVRWLVVLGLLAALVRFIRGWQRKSDWSKQDDRLHGIVVGVVDLQLTLGIALYVLSPLVQGFLADPGAAMKVRALRFFGLEHPLMMLVAVTVLHVGRARTKKAPQYRRTAINLIWVVVILCASAPWPFMPTGRPLLRGLSAPSANERATATGAALAVPPVYASRCAVCHGPSGRGDGPAAAGLVPRPRDFTTRPPARSRDELVAIIRDGGARHGLSAAMPPNPDLPETELGDLAEFVSSLSAAR